MAFGNVLFTSLNSSAVNPSFSHTAAHVPKVALVTAVNGGLSASSVLIVGITFGGVNMTKQSVSVDTAGEPGSAEIWSLTSTQATMSSGANTVAMTKASTLSFQYVCMTVTADGNITVSSTHRGAENANSSTPSVSIAKAGALRWAFGAKYDGTGSTAASTVVAGTVNVDNFDFGAITGMTGRESTAGTADVTFGWTQTADDWALVAVTVQEEAVGGGGGIFWVPQFTMTGVQ
jgi:hypothetical protein